MEDELKKSAEGTAQETGINNCAPRAGKPWIADISVSILL